MGARLAIVACSFIRRELESLAATGALGDVATHFYAGDCTVRGTAEPLGRAVLEALRGAEVAHVFAGRCASELHLPVKLAQRCRVHETTDCFQLLLGDGEVSALYERGAYVMTPGWVLSWRETMARWGFDRATAREFFGECTTELVLLETGLEPTALAEAEALADFVALPLTTHPTSLTMLCENLLARVAPREGVPDERRAIEVARAAQRKVADYAVAFELMTELASTRREADVVRQLLDVAQQLFAPTVLRYWALDRGAVTGFTAEGEAVDPSLPPPPVEEAYTLAPEGGGFRLRLAHDGQVVGVLEIPAVGLPEHLHAYVSLGVTIASVAALAIASARTYAALDRQNGVLAAANAELATANERLAATNAELAEALINVRRLGGLLPICCHCKKIRDDSGYWTKVEEYLATYSEATLSHGICPECIADHYGGFDDEPSVG